MESKTTRCISFSFKFYTFRTKNLDSNKFSVLHEKRNNVETWEVLQLFPQTLSGTHEAHVSETLDLECIASAWAFSEGIFWTVKGAHARFTSDGFPLLWTSDEGPNKRPSVPLNFGKQGRRGKGVLIM